MNRALKEFLETVLPQDHILMDEPMEKHTTFRIGGPADCFVTVDTAEQLQKVISYLQVVGWDFFLLGNGSNLLVSDRGYHGVIITLGGSFLTCKAEDDRICAGAGVLLGTVARTALEAGLCGMEFASGIPGTLGGAVRMNAGAYDGEMSMIVREVQVMAYDGEILTLSRSDMEFGYRTSAIRNRPYIVLGAVLQLHKGKKEEIAARMQELAQCRKEKQPLEFPSAGSTFKRPAGHFAGKLIMDAGLRGFACGDAQIAEKHCGFVVNRGHATAEDVKRLIDLTQEKVQEQFGVWLEPEVIFLGDFKK